MEDEGSWQRNLRLPHLLLGVGVLLAVFLIVVAATRQHPRPSHSDAIPIDRFRAAGLSVLVDDLSDERPRWRRAAMFELGRRGKGASTAAPAVLRFLVSDDPEDRLFAIGALGELAPADPTVIRGILSRLTDETECVRQAATVFAVRDDIPVLTAIRGMAKFGDDAEKAAALGVLVDRGDLTADWAPYFVARISDARSEAARIEAITMCGQLATNPDVLQALLQRCRVGSEQEAYLIGFVLAEPRGQAYERTLKELAQNAGHAAVRKVAADALRVIRGEGNSSGRQLR